MKYITRFRIGYYTDDDDDTYHGPFYKVVEFDAESNAVAIEKAERLVRIAEEELNEDYSDGALITIHNEVGESIFTDK